MRGVICSGSARVSTEATCATLNRVWRWGRGFCLCAYGRDCTQGRKWSGPFPILSCTTFLLLKLAKEKKWKQGRYVEIPAPIGTSVLAPQSSLYSILLFSKIIPFMTHSVFLFCVTASERNNKESLLRVTNGSQVDLPGFRWAPLWFLQRFLVFFFRLQSRIKERGVIEKYRNPNVYKYMPIHLTFQGTPALFLQGKYHSVIDIQ